MLIKIASAVQSGHFEFSVRWGKGAGRSHCPLMLAISKPAQLIPDTYFDLLVCCIIEEPPDCIFGVQLSGNSYSCTLRWDTGV